MQNQEFFVTIYATALLHQHSLFCFGIHLASSINDKEALRLAGWGTFGFDATEDEETDSNCNLPKL